MTKTKTVGDLLLNRDMTVLAAKLFSVHALAAEARNFAVPHPKLRDWLNGLVIETARLHLECLALQAELPKSYFED